MTTKLGFSAEYVEGLSPAERTVYIKYYLKEREEEERRKQSKQSGPQISGPVGE